MWLETFQTSLPFEAGRMLGLAGVPHTDLRYEYLYSQVVIIIRNQLSLSAKRLNSALQEDFQEAMFNIWEYREFPDYYTVMRVCLSNPAHRDVVWRNQIMQPQFIDYNLVGDVGDLQRIHIATAGGKYTGNIDGWRRFFLSWVRRRNPEYSETISARLRMMIDEGKAPFLELVEDGNTMYGVYPSNPPMGVLSKFKLFYTKETGQAFDACMRTIRSLVASQMVYGFGTYNIVTVIINERLTTGLEWISTASGRRLFVIPGTFKFVAGRPFGRGFELDAEGKVIKPYWGWLPK